MVNAENFINNRTANSRPPQKAPVGSLFGFMLFVGAIIGATIVGLYYSGFSAIVIAIGVVAAFIFASISYVILKLCWLAMITFLSMIMYISKRSV